MLKNEILKIPTTTKNKSLQSFQVNYAYLSSFKISPEDLTVTLHVPTAEDKPEKHPRGLFFPQKPSKSCLTGIYFQKRMFQKSSQQG